MLTVKKSAFVNIRAACLEDYTQIAQLASEHLLEFETCEEWKHHWLNNPIYRQHAMSWPIGWVLEDSNRKIVGYLGNIPLSYQFEGKELLAATGRAWVVDSHYRGYSLMLMDYFLSQKNVDVYINTSLSTQAFEAFRVFGPLPVPAGEWDRSRFWITNSVSFLASALRTRGVPFAKFLSYPLAVPIFMKDRLRRRYSTGNGTEADVQLCSGFDQRFDIFWEELKRNCSHLLLGTRTTDILDWHFKYALAQKKVWIFCVNEGPRLVAYSIFYRQDSVKWGLKRVRLIDFQTLANDNWHLLPMLSCALERCRDSGVHTLEIIGLCQKKSKVLEKLAPYKCKLPLWRSYYKTNNPQLAERLKEPNTWDLSLFDGDSSL